MTHPHAASPSLRPGLPALAALAALTLLAAGGCTQYEPFDSTAYLQGLYEQRLDPGQLEQAEVPFALSEPLRALVEQELYISPSEERRAEQVQEFIFDRVGLRYSLAPTKNAVDTFETASGNCLSFVNLFVGIARELRLAPFYVEVTDYNRWNYRNGMVVSQGHIVAGMRIDGKLRTYDFLPYEPKSYREFEPIDDSTAAAHYYNNLAAEALMAGKEEEALEHVILAARIAPEFTKAINNHGVTLARMGRHDEALDVYRRGLEIDPDDVALMTNTVRAYQQLGRHEEAEELIAEIDTFQHTNPFFFIYQGELALSRDQPARALEYMRDALSRDSELPEVHVGLTKVYIALGELDRARHHLGRALRLDATHREALDLARMLDTREVTAGGER